MTKIVLRTLALAAFLLIPAMASAAGGFVFQGGEMKPIEGRNAYTAVEPGCITAADGSKSTGGTPGRVTPEAEAPGETPSKS